MKRFTCIALALLATVVFAGPATITLSADQVAQIIAQQGGVTPPTPTPVPPAPVPPVTSPIPVIDMGWGNTRVFVQDLPVALKFTTGSKSSSSSLPFVAGAECCAYPPSPRYAVLSEMPGDFDHPVGGAPGAVSGPSNSVQIKFALGTGGGFGYYPVLKLNTTYYVNVRDVGSGGQMFFDLSVNSL